MPRLNTTTEHQLGESEALRRLKEGFSMARTAYQEQVKDLMEQWDGNKLLFAFKAAGMKIAGELTVEDRCIALGVDLPLAAMIFKRAIEQQIHAKLGELLAPNAAGGVS
jgi:hypothetical protein